MPIDSYDVIILGSGSAGLALALQLPGHLQIALVGKSSLGEGSSRYAQGGIACALIPTQQPTHIQDTLKAGCGLCHETTVHTCISESQQAIHWLIEQGVDFSRDNEKNLHLAQEGGHSERRIVHVQDRTGAALIETLTQKVKLKTNIHCFNEHIAIDLIKSAEGGSPVIQGVYLYHKAGKNFISLAAKVCVLATGGASKAYLYNTNPHTSSGDGIAMAYRAGASIANMEFNQFHPTCLYHPHAGSFLISEAVRGEGGVLLGKDHKRFMPSLHEQADLAPRDIVARAIDYEMKRHGLDHVYLDISHRDPAFIRHAFPTIYQKCLEFGIDITTSPIPVVPAAHYTCGGVVTDLNGATTLTNLYAIGEVAFTGLHGANRMASNSLLECLVFAKRCAHHIKTHIETITNPRPLPEWDESFVTESNEEVVVTHNWDEVRRLMWDYVGIVRSDKRLMQAATRINILKQEIKSYYASYKVTADLIELRHLVEVAGLMIRSASMRLESRGLHFNLDHPQQNDLYKKDTIVQLNQQRAHSESLVVA